MKKYFNKPLFILFGIILLTAFVYRDSFNSRFFQDDKLNLELAASKNFLAFVPGANHYRPISIQSFYLVGETFFGLNPLGYHLLEFVFFAATSWLIYKISHSLMVVFLYALNVSLFANFYWIANSQFVLGGFFFFLTFWLFQKNSWWAVPAFILGVLSNEQILALIPLLIITNWFFRQKFSLNVFLVLCLLGSLWFVFRLFHLPTTTDYALVFQPVKILATLRWYLLRALDLPEGVRVSTTTIAFLFFIVFPKAKPDLKIVAYGLVWFILGLWIFLFIPGHISAHYLTVSLFGSSLVLAQLLPKNKIGLVVCLLIYLSQTMVSLNFLAQTHWIILKNTGPIGKF